MSPVRRVSIFEAKKYWNTLVPESFPLPMFSAEWYETWISANKDFEEYLLFIGETTLAPFVRQSNTVTFAYKFTDYNDIIGVQEDTWPFLLAFLKRDKVAHLILDNILPSSPTIVFFQKLQAEEKNCIVEEVKTAPFLTLPPTFSEYLSVIGAKRQKYNKFLREYPNAKVFISANLEKDVHIWINLMNLNPIKRAKFTPAKEAFFIKMVHACRSNIKLGLLIVDEKPIAAHMLFTHKKRLMSYNSGYDKEHFPNAGTFLTISLIKYGIEHGYKIFDFLTGKEVYKYELGAKDFPLYKIFLKI